MIGNTQSNEQHPQQHGSLQQEAVSVVGCFISVFYFLRQQPCHWAGKQRYGFQGMCGQKVAPQPASVIKSINVSSRIHPISKILGNKNLIYSHSIWSVNATIMGLPLAFD